MKPSEIREMTLDDLTKKVNELSKELFTLRFQHTSGQLENPIKITQVRKDIARVRTIQKEKSMEKRG